MFQLLSYILFQGNSLLILLLKENDDHIIEGILFRYSHLHVVCNSVNFKSIELYKIYKKKIISLVL